MSNPRNTKSIMELCSRTRRRNFPRRRRNDWIILWQFKTS